MILAVTFLAFFTIRRTFGASGMPLGCLTVTQLAAVDAYLFGLGFRFSRPGSSPVAYVLLSPIRTAERTRIRALRVE